MIAVGKEKEKIRNKDRWNYCHHMPMLSFLGVNHSLLLLHMTKRLFFLKKHMNLLMILRLDI